MRRGSTDRLPLALSLTALLVAVLGLTPLGEAALRRVPFARNTEAVNGVHASRVPRPNTLLPLGSDARFPVSVVPELPAGRGPAGETGPQGEQGPRGPDGGRAIVLERKRAVELPAGETTVAAFDPLPQGAWVLVASVGLLSNDHTTRTRVRCELTRGGDELGYGQATVGKLVGAARVATLPVIGAVQQTAAERVELTCSHDGDGVGRPVDMPRASLAALRVTSIEEFEGGP